MADNRTPVDRVSIEISAATTDASRKINSLKTAMKNLRDVTSQTSNDVVAKMKTIVQTVKSLEGANKITLSKSLSTSIKALGTAIDGISVSAVQRFTSLAATLKAMETIGKISISKTVGDGLSGIAEAVNKLTDASMNRLISLTYILKALAAIGNISLSSTIGKNIAAIADGANQITQTGIANLTNMVDQLIRLKDVDLSGVSGAAKAAGNLAKQEAKAAAKSEKEKSGGDSETKNKLQLTWSLKKNVEAVSNHWASKLNPAINVTVSLIGSVVKGVAKLAASIAKIGFNIIKSAITGIVNSVKTLSRWITEIAKKLPGIAANFLGFKGIAKTIDSIKQSISGLMRIAVYRVARTAIKAVTEAFKEGSERAYFYAKQYGVATKYISDSLDQMSSASFKMDNQLGAAWATLLSTIQPVLITLINLVNAAAEAMTRLFALFGGRGSYLKAKDYTKNWADETAKGAAAAKEWKNQLMGFDEINRLTEPSSGGGGAADLYTDYENMFEEIKVEGGIFDAIKEKIEAGDWAGLGRLLGEKFNDMISNADFGGFGKKVGEKIGAAISTSYNFLKTADFKNLGNRIMEAIDSLADEINFNELGRLVTRIKTAIWDVLVGAFTRPGSMAKLAQNLSEYVKGALDELADWIIRLDPIAIATAIQDFFGNIDSEGIMHKIKNVIILAWNKLEGIAHVLFPEGIMTTLSKEIAKRFENMNWLETYTAIKDKLKAVWQQITLLFDQIWPPEQRDEFKRQMKEKLTDILTEAFQMAADAAFNALPRRIRILFYKDGEDSGAEYVSGVEKSIEDGKKGINTSLDEGIVKPSESAMVSFLKNIGLIKTGYALEAEDINKVSGDVKEDMTTNYSAIGKDVPKSIDTMQTKVTKSTNLMASGFEKARDLSTKAGETMKEKLGQAWAGISQTTELVTLAIQTKTSQAWANIKQNATTSWGNIKTDLGIVWDAIKLMATTTWDGVKTAASIAWTSISTAASGAWGSILTSASQAAGSLVNIVSGMLDGIGGAIDNIREWLSDAIDYAWDAASSIRNAISNAYDNARDWASETYSNVSSKVTSTVNTVVNNFKNAIGKIKWFSSGGFPEDGLFFANHTELVGRFDNGKTAVANNEMITQGIASAVYGAFTQALSESGGAGSDRTIVITMDGKEIARTTTKYQRQLARAAG